MHLSPFLIGYLLVSTFLLGWVAVVWSDCGAVNVLLKSVFVAATLAGAILIASSGIISPWAH